VVQILGLTHIFGPDPRLVEKTLVALDIVVCMPDHSAQLAVLERR